MGLDLVFGAIILGAAFRGWFRGFVSQTVRLASLVACVYLGDRVRDYVKPYVTPYLASIQADLIDRLLWWVSAVATWVVLVGVASLVIKMTRRPEIPGISRKGLNDQFAGFMLGAVKGVLIAAFLIHGVQSHGMAQVKTVEWADEQVKASWAFRWSEAYQPVPKIWSSRIVRHFVARIEQMGIRKPGEVGPPDENDGAASEAPVRTANSRIDPGVTGGSRSDGDRSSSSTPAAHAGSNSAEPLDLEAEKTAPAKKPRDTTELEGSN
jgi:uncharacterized membrane protein required for colicin V production